MVRVSVVRTEAASIHLLERVRALLDDAFLGAFAEEDWEHTLGGWHVVAREGVDVLAHAAVVPRLLVVGERPLRTGYVEGVATRSTRQDQGLGSQVMSELNTIVTSEFELGALSTDRHSFYGRLGWERWQGPTFVRDRHDLIRTPDEDDGVMVLRCGASSEVDLDDPISCEARVGDDW